MVVYFERLFTRQWKYNEFLFHREIAKAERREKINPSGPQCNLKPCLFASEAVIEWQCRLNRIWNVFEK